jgi:hypothetical protein
MFANDIVLVLLATAAAVRRLTNSATVVWLVTLAVSFLALRGQRR